MKVIISADKIDTDSQNYSFAKNIISFAMGLGAGGIMHKAARAIINLVAPKGLVRILLGLGDIGYSIAIHYEVSGWISDFIDTLVGTYNEAIGSLPVAKETEETNE